MQLGKLIDAMIAIAEHHHVETNIEGIRISVTQAAQRVDRTISVEVTSREPRIFPYHAYLGLNTLEIAEYACETIQRFK
jgi:hypothetical protein